MRPAAVNAEPPEGRTAVFLGDLVDRGPDSPGVLRLVMGMVAAGHALAVPGNHENKLIRALGGRDVQVSHGLAETLSQLAGEDEAFRQDVAGFCRGLVSHLVLDGGRLVVAHAGLKEAYQGRASGRVRSFALYGDTTGETDEFGLPVRYPWASDYRGRAMVLYGHTPAPDPEWVNNTLCLDTGCVFGGRLTALRYPEKELVSVPAQQVWYKPARPFPPSSAAPAAPLPARDPGVLDITDVLGKRVIETAQHGRVTVREENAAGALEVMSRFAVDPRWLLYLPPTMAPPPTSSRPDLLEHPAEAFAAYRADGVTDVICEEKHMGSRAVLLACRDEDTARARFGGAGRPARGGLYPDRAAVLQPGPQPGAGTGRAGPQPGPGPGPARDQPGAAGHGARRDRRGRALGRAGHRLAAARLRADALVGQGRRPAAAPVRRGRGRGPGRAAGGRPPAQRGGRAGRGRRGAGRPDRGPGRQRRGVHRRVPPVLLAGQRPGRGTAGPVPGPGHGGRRLPRT